MILEQTYKVLLYNKSWNMYDEEYSYPIVDNYELTSNHKYMDEAVALIFHMPTMKPDDIIWKKGKKKGQIWIFWSMECEENYKWQYEPAIYDLFDIKATYKLDSDIPVPYIYRDSGELLRRTPLPKTGLINAFISSTLNQSNRLKYLEELMSYINVHSYGKMLNNRSLDSDEGVLTKENVIAGYKFSIAFENAIAKDYVTEKFFQPLMAGSVPIYLGAPNIDDFAPGDNCYINVESFSTVKALADYLLELDADDKRYEAYMKWKQLPFRNTFGSIAKLVEKQPLIRLCELIRNGY